MYSYSSTYYRLLYNGRKNSESTHFMITYTYLFDKLTKARQVTLEEAISLYSPTHHTQEEINAILTTMVRKDGLVIEAQNGLLIATIS